MPGKADAAASNTSSGDAADIADILGGAAGNLVQTAPALPDEFQRIRLHTDKLESCVPYFASRPSCSYFDIGPKLKPEGVLQVRRQSLRLRRTT